MFQPPRDLPMLCSPFVFRAPVPSGCTLTLVLSRPKRGEQLLKHAAAGPAAEPRVDREPIAEPLRQRAPLAAVLQDVQDRVDEVDGRNPHVPALNREQRADFGVLFCCGLFHDCVPPDFYVIVDSHLSTDPSKNLVLTGPSAD